MKISVSFSFPMASSTVEASTRDMLIQKNGGDSDWRVSGGESAAFGPNGPSGPLAVVWVGQNLLSSSWVSRRTTRTGLRPPHLQSGRRTEPPPVPTCPSCANSYTCSSCPTSSACPSCPTCPTWPTCPTCPTCSTYLPILSVLVISVLSISVLPVLPVL